MTPEEQRRQERIKQFNDFLAKAKKTSDEIIAKGRDMSRDVAQKANEALEKAGDKLDQVIGEENGRPISPPATQSVEQPVKKNPESYSRVKRFKI